MDNRYAAGLLDGEGCILLPRQQFKNHIRYHLRVTMRMTDPRPLLALKEAYGGSLCVGTKPKDPRHRQTFGWTIVSRECAEFLKAVRPWLIVKAEEADLGIEFQDGVTYGVNSPDEIARRERLRLAILRVKHKERDPLDFGMTANSGDTQNGQSRAKQGRGRPVLGVCNDQVLSSTEKI